MFLNQTNSSEWQVTSIYHALNLLSLYSTFIALVPGFFLNCFSVYVFARPRFSLRNRTSMGFFYTYQAALNSLSVLMGLSYYLPVAIGYDLTSKILIWCKIHWFFRTSFINASGLFTIFITIDRTMSTLYYHKFTCLKNKTTLSLIALSITVFSFGLSGIVNLWRYIKPGSSSTSLCVLSQDLTIYFSIVVIIFRLLPTFTNLPMNFIIIKLFKDTKRAVMSRNVSIYKESAFALSLIWQNFIFFCLTLPVVIVSMIQLTISIKGEANSSFGIEINILFLTLAWGTFYFEWFVI